MEDQSILKMIDDLSSEVKDVGQFLWENAEQGYHEYKSSDYLARAYESHGFYVYRGIGGFPTGFFAEWCLDNKKSPCICFLSDFDALPGLSLIKEGGCGHGCMHNQYAARAFGTAVGLKNYMEKHGIPGKILVCGAPAEEAGGSKQYLVAQGLLDEVDIFIGLHPVSHVNGVMFNRHLASTSHTYYFRGNTAHAALCPEKGDNALSAMEYFDIGVQFLRAQLPSTVRINNVIRKAGLTSNMIADYAEVEYSLRAIDLETLNEICRQVDQVACSAAQALRCSVEIQDNGRLANSIPNYELAKIVHQHALELGPPAYSEEDNISAAKKGFTSGYLPQITDLAKEPSIILGSTDEGDISWLAPWIRINMVNFPQGVPGHSKSEVFYAGSNASYIGTILTIKLATLVVLDLLQHPEKIRAAKEEHTKQIENKTYIPVRNHFPEPAYFPRIPEIRLEGHQLLLDFENSRYYYFLKENSIRVVNKNGDIIARGTLNTKKTLMLELEPENSRANDLRIDFLQGDIWGCLGYI